SVRRHASADAKPIHLESAAGLATLRNEHIHDRRLKTRRTVGDNLRRKCRIRSHGALPEERVPHGCLESAETEVEPILFEERPWKRKGLRISVDCGFFDRRSAWVSHSQQTRDLIERFAGSVVDRA